MIVRKCVYVIISYQNFKLVPFRFLVIRYERISNLIRFTFVISPDILIVACNLRFRSWQFTFMLLHVFLGKPTAGTGLKSEWDFASLRRVYVASLGHLLSSHVNMLAHTYLCYQTAEEDESDARPQFAGGKVTLVTTKDVWDRKLSEAKTQGKIVVVNFSASWCGPCKLVAPLYIELSEKHPSLMFLTVDVEALTEFSTQWDIKATPTFFFLRDGQQFDKLVGANKQELEKKISSMVVSQAPGGQK
ncbi:hypothetical protein L2E82_01359 [Cichorium intybus]|uniref:Uncharacterized protein n=1 Tax=Cichorium intybus TaxID=13427 RepID=A0ACB9GYD9_CICIN|nr:hypothetical protein L2E82_01359 [Cichorium intybus]